MLLNKLDLEKAEQLHNFLDSSPYTSLTQTWEWAQVKNNWQSNYFYLEKDDAIYAALSVLSIYDKRIGGRLFYAPRGPVCDLYDRDTVAELVAEASAYAKENEGFLLRIDPEIPENPELEALYAERGFVFQKNHAATSQPLQSLVLDFQQYDYKDSEDILASLSKNTRKMVRRSYRLGISNRIGDKADLPEFYRILETMNNYHGITYRPYEYFARLYDAYAEKVRLSFSMYEGKAIATSLLILHGERAFSIYGADTHEYNLGQSYQINFEELKFTFENGYRYYDMGGIFSTSEEDGLYQFKKKFTGDGVVNWIGNLDIALDGEKYAQFIAPKKG